MLEQQEDHVLVASMTSSAPEAILIDSGAGAGACPWDYAPEAVAGPTGKRQMVIATNENIAQYGEKKVGYRTCAEDKPVVFNYRVSDSK